MKVPRGAVSAEEWRALEQGSVAHVRGGESRFVVSGTGALACLQGLVTCDLKAPPPGSRAFGALLTSKGMIVAPLWIEKRDETHFTLETPDAAAGVLEQTLVRSLPPRLAKLDNVTASTAGVGVYGPKATGLPRAVVRGAPGSDTVMEPAAARELAAAGVRASDALMETCRILAGIPGLGSEIDEKTLPQEVRFDELDAVSYTKGCYLGQETVARVHFRGHPNRRLALVVLDGEPVAVPLELTDAAGKIAGRLSSAAWSEELDSWVGQAVLRREVEHQAELAVAGGGMASVNLERWIRAA